MDDDQYKRTQEAASRARDRRLRRITLEAINREKINEHGGWVSGTMLLEFVRASVSDTDSPSTDEHMLSLLRDLVIKGYAEEQDRRTDRSQQFRLEFLVYRITGKGISLVNYSAAVDADVEDPRICKN